MKVRFSARTVFETEGRKKGPVYEAGSVHDLPDEMARRWLRRGVAVEVTRASGRPQAASRPAAEEDAAKKAAEEEAAKKAAEEEAAKKAAEEEAAKKAAEEEAAKKVAKKAAAAKSSKGGK